MSLVARQGVSRLGVGREGGTKPPHSKRGAGLKPSAYVTGTDCGNTPIDQAKSSGRIGRRRMGLPVTAKMALQTAGAMGGVPGSPTPPGGSLLGTMWTSILGISFMRNIS